MKHFAKLRALIAAAETDAVKFYEKGNKAAGTRLRKAMLEVKTLARDIRMEVSQIKKSA